jgi:integrase/recombinase XerD
MPYQYTREPLTADEADRLANAFETPTEQLIVWTLLDTGLRISGCVTCPPSISSGSNASSA